MTLGWIGNVLILVALYLLGYKNRVGWLFSIVGNLFWCAYALQLQMMDVLFIDLLSLILASHNYLKWAPNE